MFTVVLANGYTKSCATLADALAYCGMTFDAIGDLPFINDANGEVAYAIDACGIAYALNTVYAQSSFNDYFARQAM